MRKSIVLLTLAALTAGLATGCAPAGQVPTATYAPHVANDYVPRKPLVSAVILPTTPAAPLAQEAQAAPRLRVAARLARPAGEGGR
jgi:hypothetical protein